MEKREPGTESLTLRDKESVVRQDAHIIAIEQDEEFVAPEINYSAISVETKSFKKHVERLVSFLNKRYYIDDFGESDEARHKWLDNSDAKYPWFSQVVDINNCFPLKHFVTLQWAVENLKNYYTGSGAEENARLLSDVDASIQIILDIPVRAYGGVDPEEKKRMIREVKDKIKKVIDFYSTQN